MGSAKTRHPRKAADYNHKILECKQFVHSFMRRCKAEASDNRREGSHPPAPLVG